MVSLVSWKLPDDQNHYRREEIKTIFATEQNKAIVKDDAKLINDKHIQFRLPQHIDKPKHHKNIIIFCKFLAFLFLLSVLKALKSIIKPS